MLSDSNPQKPSEKIIYAQISEKQNTITNLRIKMQKQEKQMQALEKTIKEKDKEILKIKTVRFEKNLIKQDEEIARLKEIISNHDQNVEDLKVQMGLDNQIQLLFPRRQNIMLKFMNTLLVFEDLAESKKGKACKVVINNVRPLCKFIADGFQRAVDYV